MKKLARKWKKALGYALSAVMVSGTIADLTEPLTAVAAPSNVTYERGSDFDDLESVMNSFGAIGFEQLNASGHQHTNI